MGTMRTGRLLTKVALTIARSKRAFFWAVGSPPLLGFLTRRSNSLTCWSVAIVCSLSSLCSLREMGINFEPHIALWQLTVTIGCGEMGGIWGNRS